MRFYCLPFKEIYKLQYHPIAGSIDNKEPIIVNTAFDKLPNEHNAEWQNNVMRAASIKEMKQSITTTGEHTLKIQMIDPGVVIDKIELYFTEPKATYFW